MKWIGYLFSSLWRIWFLLSFFSVFILFIPSLFLFTAIIKNNHIVNHLTRYWSGMFMILSGIFWKVEFEEKLDPKKRYIFCPNHSSTLDIPLVTVAIPLPLLFMGKKEITKIPIFGFFYKGVCILVDRSSAKSRTAVYKSAQRRLKQGLSICIFPEGGVPDDLNIVLDEFKEGAFRLAIEHQIPIVPVVFLDNKKRFSYEFFSGSPGRTRAIVMEFLNTHGLKSSDATQIKLHARQAIYDHLS